MKMLFIALSRESKCVTVNARRCYYSVCLSYIIAEFERVSTECEWIKSRIYSTGLRGGIKWCKMRNEFFLPSSFGEKFDWAQFVDDYYFGVFASKSTRYLCSTLVYTYSRLRMYVKAFYNIYAMLNFCNLIWRVKRFRQYKLTSRSGRKLSNFTIMKSFLTLYMYNYLNLIQRGNFGI